MSDLISEDTAISADGAVTGTLHYVESMESFPEGENSGHYMPVTLDSKYAGKDITVKGKKTATAQDLEPDRGGGRGLAGQNGAFADLPHKGGD